MMSRFMTEYKERTRKGCAFFVSTSFTWNNNKGYIAKCILAVLAAFCGCGWITIHGKRFRPLRGLYRGEFRPYPICAHIDLLLI